MHFTTFENARFVDSVFIWNLRSVQSIYTSLFIIYLMFKMCKI